MVTSVLMESSLKLSAKGLQTKNPAARVPDPLVDGAFMVLPSAVRSKCPCASLLALVRTIAEPASFSNCASRTSWSFVGLEVSGFAVVSVVSFHFDY